MKKMKVFSLVAIMFIVSTFTLFAGVKIDKFKVAGNCDMCKTRIEKAALAVEGVSNATWSPKTKVMVVMFDEKKTNAHKIQMAIAKVGHDTEMHKAEDEDYNKLQGCCRYDRSGTKTKTKGHEGHEYSGCTRSQMNTGSGSCCDKK
ncbi:MAG: heavy-metal-associated domain-containing protein [Bacteroidales bacterium]|nr:heavy-metal-associated domain-containing protein [Bacteroidales bacterium]